MPPSLSRGASKEQVDIVRGQMQALDHSIKKLSREGSTLKAELDASDLAQVSGKPLTKLTMREIFELSHKRAPQVAPEIPKSAWGELGHVYTADDVHYKKKTMREIAAEAQAEEAAKIEAERQRLLALRHSSSKHIGGARGGPKSLLSAWDDRYEEDATQVRPLGHHGGELQSSSKHLSTRSLTHSSASLGASSQSRSSGLDVRSMPRSSGVDDSDSARMSSRISRVSMPRVSETVGGSSSSALPLDEPEPTPGGRTRTRRRAVATVTLEGALGVATRSHHGIEWETRVLPLLEDTVSSCGADHAYASSLAHLNPSAAFVAAYRLIMRRDPSDPPAPQASTETVKNYDARAAVQASTRALILPRGGQETEDDYRMRLDAFKRSGVRGGMQRAGTSKASMATLVFPKVCDLPRITHASPTHLPRISHASPTHLILVPPSTTCSDPSSPALGPTPGGT